MKVLMISADGFEDLELLIPYYRFQEEGIPVDLVSMREGKITGKHGYEVNVEKTLSETDTSAYDVLVLPGGKAPAAVRADPKAVQIAKSFVEAGKTVAAICHGPQILVTAGVLRGRRATCYKSVAPELKEAGAHYEDAEVVVDGNLITSRQPGDLPAFMRELMRMIRAAGWRTSEAKRAA
ncbi:MAG: type 1 glutamine amidotransferase [Deltaproteobacteria bacterium]|nr:type 1 glutamine amidotransferase [Deltaproteobacteria bacterium]